MKKLDHIDAILFDMMGVLLFPRKDYQPDLLVNKVDNLIGNVIDDNLFKKKILKEFYLNENNFNKTIEKIVNKYEPFKELWSILSKLKKHYKLAIVNNGTAFTLPGFDKKLNFKKYFDLFVSSAKEETKKPESKIFLTTAKRLKVAPERCLFMDDSLQNIEGAKKLGMATIYWENPQTGFIKFKEFLNII